MNFRYLNRLVIVLILALGLVVVSRVRAQSTQEPWQAPTNVSQSGAASQPIIAAAPDGSLHAMWWDATEGEQYARTITPTSSLWTRPIGMPDIVGLRRTDPQTGRETISAPREVRLTANTRGDIYAFWFNADDRLFVAQTQDASWSAGTILADRATVIDAAADYSGTLHLAYVRPLDTEVAPSGIYYRSNVGAQWGDSQLVYASAYMRSATPDQLNISVAGNGAGQVLVAWDDPQVKQSVYARSGDGGTTWSEVQVITSTTTSQTRRARVASTTTGEFLMIWQDSSLSGCGLVQRESRDGGLTWGAPHQVLGQVTRCSEVWSFMPSNDGRLWLIGRSVTTSPAEAVSAVTIAAWNGADWSEPGSASLSFYDSSAKRLVNLNCVGVAVAGQTAGLIGCDANGDIWGARSSTGLSDLVTALKSPWSSIETLSDRAAQIVQDDLPVVVSDQQGNILAMWGQFSETGEPGAALYASTYSNGRWSRTAQVLRSPAILAATTTAKQPALAIDNLNKVHAVWTSGTNSPVFYSWTYARDFTSANGWAEPIDLPVAASISSRPSIAVDPAGSKLFVAYAVPFNEHRGIYLNRSNDGGSTWLTATVISDAQVANWDRVDKPQIVWDAKSKVLHAVWLQAALPDSMNSQAIYYARSVDQGLTWSESFKVATGLVDWPRLAVDQANYVYLSWTQLATALPTGSPTPYGVWSAFSPDGGQRWSEPAAVLGFQQVSGPNGLSADATGHVYLAAVGAGSGSESTLYYTYWSGQGWNEREDYGLGQPAAASNAVNLAIASQSGQLSALLRLWMWQASNTGQFATVGTNRAIETNPVLPGPTLTPLPEPSPTPTAVLQPTATVLPKFEGSIQQSRSDSPSLPPLALGGVLAASIVVLAIVRTIWVRRR